MRNGKRQAGEEKASVRRRKASEQFNFRRKRYLISPFTKKAVVPRMAPHGPTSVKWNDLKKVFFQDKLQR